MKKPQSVEEVNAAVEEAGNRARLRHGPPSVERGFYFVNVGKNQRACRVQRASCVSDLTIEEWIEELQSAEVRVALNRR